MAYVDTIGRWGQGNIDLNNRIIIHNSDGSISSELSFSTNIDGEEVLLPTIVYGKKLSQNDAIAHYYATGEYLGKFNSVAAADAYAEALHERQAWYYYEGVFNGKLIECKVGTNYVEIPLRFIKSESYKVTPDQRMESSANRSANGVLKRTTVAHTASKIDFTTVPLVNRDVKEIDAILNSAYTNVLERKLDLRYYNPQSDEYKTGTFYVPDTDFDIMRVDKRENVVWYNPVRFAFIEY